ncbi:glutathione S-transferase family protein [Sorangium sp. So ce363]|uniref:glutathione S-transferase family protein n=1 Tax=unclassified Sorangium TaxID=2621164 RepID=UPI003F63E66A
MKIQLYYYPGNANLAPHLLLQEAGCDFELVLVDRDRREQKSANYLRLNPNGVIPTLVCGELVLFESAAICLYIADQYPSARLIPPLGSSERAHLYKWLFFLSNTVQPAYVAYRYPEKYAANLTQSDGAQPTSGAVDEVRAAAAARAMQAFEVIENAWGSGPFMLGEAYSACDAYLYMLTWWARKLPRPPHRMERIGACIDAVGRRSATQRACAAEGIEVRFET